MQIFGVLVHLWAFGVFWHLGRRIVIVIYLCRRFISPQCVDAGCCYV